MNKLSETDLVRLETAANDPSQWYSGGGYQYVEVDPFELHELVSTIYHLRWVIAQQKEKST